MEVSKRQLLAGACLIFAAIGIATIAVNDVNAGGASALVALFAVTGTYLGMKQ